MAHATIKSQRTLDDGTNIYVLKADEVRRLLNAAPVGSTYHIGVRVELPTVEADGAKTGDYFPGYSLARVGRDVAIKFAADSLRHFEERGARIEVSEHFSASTGHGFYVVG